MKLNVVRMLPIAALAFAAFSQSATAAPLATLLDEADEPIARTAFDEILNEVRESDEVDVRPDQLVSLESGSVQCDREDFVCQMTCNGGFGEGYEFEVDPQEKVVVPGPGLRNGWEIVIIGHYTICLP